MYIRFLIDTRIFHLAEIRAVKLIETPLRESYSPLSSAIYGNGIGFAHRFTCNLNRWSKEYTSKERDKSGLCEEISASIYRAEIEMRETSS